MASVSPPAILGRLRARLRAVRLARILRTPPLPTDPVPGPEATPVAVTVHALCCAGDWIAALWALKSFYHYAATRYPLVIHLQGPSAPTVPAGLRAHFPAARVVPQAEADAVAEPWLLDRGLRRLCDARRRLYLMMKITDIPLYARSANALYIDSDVLFFRRPAELIEAAAAPAGTWRFQRDCFDSYVLTPAEARADLGVDLVPRLNSGLALFPPPGVDPARCDAWLAHPRLASLHYHTEQTLLALSASSAGAVRHLPDDYFLGMGRHPDPAAMVARHYITPVRPLLHDEGLAWLTRLGFLDALRRDRAPAAP